MATLVSTGQITIVDSNDVRPIVAMITTNTAFQNAYDPVGNTYTPNWASANLVMSAEVYVGTTNIAHTLTNKKWTLSTDRNTALANDTNWVVGAGTTAATTTLTRKTNVASDAPLVVFFEGDYTDPVTLVTTHVVASATLGRVTVGSNAVYVEITGNDVIKKPATGKGVTALRARLVRPSGYDEAGLSFTWSVSPFSAAIDANTSNVGAQYGFKATASNAAPAATESDLNKNIPAAGGATTFNTIVISEAAVAGLQFFKVDIVDSSPGTGNAAAASGFFAIRDSSDPYAVNVVSTAGDKFQNATGSTYLYPEIFLGGNRVTDTTGWTFNWQLYDKLGNLGAFVDSAKTASATGISISSNSAVSGGDMTITLPSAYTFAAGDTVKVVANATATYFKIKTAGTATNTLTVTNDAAFPVTGWATNQLSNNGYKLYFCQGQVVTGCVVTTNGGTGTTVNGITTYDSGKILLSDFDVEAKARIACAVNRP